MWNNFRVIVSHMLHHGKILEKDGHNKKKKIDRKVILIPSGET